MARDNYSYQKYQRELAKKKKKEEKLAKKLNKRLVKEGEEAGGVVESEGQGASGQPPVTPGEPAGPVDPGPGQSA